MIISFFSEINEKKQNNAVCLSLPRLLLQQQEVLLLSYCCTEDVRHSSSRVVLAIQMSAAPAFVAHTPHLYTSHALETPWLHQHTHTTPRRPRVWLPLVNATPNPAEQQQQDGTFDGSEVRREPTLEESLDAIDDVFMDRLPGEGESFPHQHVVPVVASLASQCTWDSRCCCCCL